LNNLFQRDLVTDLLLGSESVNILIHLPDPIYGFLRVACEGCSHEKLVAFSCKRRGFCPSCGGRRMAETAAFLMDEVFPRVPIRQWVLSFPFPLRYLMASNSRVQSAILAITLRVITGLRTCSGRLHGGIHPIQDRDGSKSQKSLQ
jgi:ribosomal protein S27E